MLTNHFVINLVCAVWFAPKLADCAILQSFFRDQKAEFQALSSRYSPVSYTHLPIKVTINEYLDIAKEYSTPKSKDFINGVLDALMKDLKDKNLLNKIGRGLL